MNIPQNQKDTGNGNNNFVNNAMNEDDLKNSPTGQHEVSIPVTDVRMRSVNIKSKNSNGYVNPGEADSLDIEDSPDSPDPQEEVKMKKPLGYAAKKTAAQGMIDIALLTSNANQLRNLIEYQRETVTFYFVMILIILSLMLQITVGVVLIFKGRFNSKSNAKDAASRVCTWIMAATFLITIINLFIPIFSIPQNTFTPVITNQTTA